MRVREGATGGCIEAEGIMALALADAKAHGHYMRHVSLVQCRSLWWRLCDTLPHTHTAQLLSLGSVEGLLSLPQVAFLAAGGGKSN